MKEEVINQSIIILILVDSCKGLDEERLERMLYHQSWTVSILFLVLIEYTWPISFKFMSCYICLSTIAIIFVDIFLLYNLVE